MEHDYNAVGEIVATDACGEINANMVTEDNVDRAQHPDPDGPQILRECDDTDEHATTDARDSSPDDEATSDKIPSIDDDRDFRNAPIADPDRTLAVLHLIRKPLESPGTQIRLLRLLPGTEEDAIHVTVSIWDMIDAPAFYAISYTWGPPEPEAYIYLCASVDSDSAERHVLRVRENARYALWQARLHRPGTYVWIDSVCIDQENLAEKSAQVAIMGEVYFKAHEVLACIGPSDEASDAVEEACRDIDGTVHAYPGDFNFSNSPKDGRKTPKGDSALLQFANCWDTFSSRRYFRRLWVIQELYGGRENFILLCGRYTLSWSFLRELQWRLVYWCRWFDPDFTSRNNCSQAIRDLNYWITRNTDGDILDYEDLGLMIGQTRQYQCENPVDRIYGIIGVIDWKQLGIEKPIPNYKISRLDLALSLLPRTGTVAIYLPRAVALAVGLRPVAKGQLNTFPDGIHIRSRGRADPGTASWYMPIQGLCVVRQDSRERLSLNLESHPRKSVEDLEVLKVLQASPETVGDCPLPFNGNCQPVELYTGDEVSALAWPQVQQYDIVIHALDTFDAILRRSNVDGQYRVVGKALFLGGYRPKDYRNWTCGCWPEPMREVSQLGVSLMGHSEVDVLINANFHRFGSPLNQVQLLSLDFPRMGSVVKYLTNEPRQPCQSIRPLNTSCTVHDTENCNRCPLDAWQFAIASGCGPWVQSND